MKIITVTFGVPDGTTGQQIFDDLVGLTYVLVSPRVLRDDLDVALVRTLESGDHVIGMTARSAQTIQTLADNADEDRETNRQWEPANALIDDDPPSQSSVGRHI